MVFVFEMAHGTKAHGGQAMYFDGAQPPAEQRLVGDHRLNLAMFESLKRASQPARRD